MVTVGTFPGISKDSKPQLPWTGPFVATVGLFQNFVPLNINLRSVEQKKSLSEVTKVERYRPESPETRKNASNPRIWGL